MKGAISLIYETELGDFVSPVSNHETKYFNTPEINVQLYKNLNSEQMVIFNILLTIRITININQNTTLIQNLHTKKKLEIPYNCEDKNEFFQLNCFYDFTDFEFDDLIKIQEWVQYFMDKL